MKYDFTEQDIMSFEDKIRYENFQVLILFAQGYTLKQMADYLHIPKNTVGSRLLRGRAVVKKLLLIQETEIKEMYDGASA